jgi:hypothetical protein
MTNLLCPNSSRSRLATAACAVLALATWAGLAFGDDGGSGTRAKAALTTCEGD